MSVRIHSDDLLVHVSVDVGTRTLEDALLERGLFCSGLSDFAPGRTVGVLSEFPRPDDANLRAGRFVDRIVGLRGRLHDGVVIAIAPAPRRATGPALAALFVGARRAFGAVEEISLVVERAPQRRISLHADGLSKEQALSIALGLVSADVPLESLRLDAGQGWSVAITLSGEGALVDAQRSVADRIATRAGAAWQVDPSPMRAVDAPERRLVAASFPELRALFDRPTLALRVVSIVGWHRRGAAWVAESEAASVVAPSTSAALSARIVGAFQRS